VPGTPGTSTQKTTTQKLPPFEIYPIPCPYGTKPRSNYCTIVIAVTGKGYPALPPGCSWLANNTGDPIESCLSTSPYAKTQQDAFPAVRFGLDNPSPVCVTHWQVVYAGRTYTYPPALNDCGGGISTSSVAYKVTCDNAPTYATVSYWLNVPPANWPFPNLNGAEPVTPSGPFTTTVEFPPCAPDAQIAPTGVSWSLAYGPSTLNSERVVADGAAHAFVVEPHITNGVDPELRWNGFTTRPSITNYSSDQVGIAGNNTAWDVTVDPHSPLLDQVLPAADVGVPTTSDISAGGPLEPIVDVTLDQPSTLGRPFDLHIAGSYSAAWAYWYTGVFAVVNCNPAQKSVITGINPGHGAYHAGGTWVPLKYDRKTHATTGGYWDGGYEVPATSTTYDYGTWYWGSSCSVGNAHADGLNAVGGHQATFGVATDIPIVGIKPYITTVG